MILVTGGCGYIGGNIIERLSEIGISYSNIDLKLGLDIRNIEDIRKVFKTNEYDIVIHCAALKSVPESITNSIEYYETNVLGTINLLKVMKENNCNKIIFSSSAAVYDKLSPYASTKAMCEQIIKDSGIDYTIFRFFNVCGKDGNEFINKIIRKEHITINGNDYNTKDGTCIRDFIHVDDIVSAHIKAINYDIKGVFDLGIGKGYSVKELCDISKCPYSYGKRRSGDIVKSVSNITPAITQLKWKPLKTIYDMLEVI